MLRAARPIVWISELSRAQEAFLVRIEDRDQRHLGHVEAFAQQVDADEHVELAEAQVADDLRALHGLDVRVQVAHPHAVLVQVLGEILGHALRQRRDQHALVLLARSLLISDSTSSTWRAHRADLDLRIDEAAWAAPAAPRPAPHARASYLPGVADTKIICGASCSHSSNFSGRLSSADGRRKPYSTSVSLRERSPLYMAPSCGMVWWLSSIDQQRVVRQIVEQARRRLARRAARQIARVVLDAGAIADLLHHLHVEHACAARAAALRRSLLCVAQLVQPLAQILADLVDGADHALLRRHVVRAGIHRETRHLALRSRR